MRENVRLPGAARERQLKDTGEDTIVEQWMATETDVNVIMKRFIGTGQLPVVSVDGVYGDFTGIMDYESAQDRIDSAYREFMKLDPKVRERFGNDPAALLTYAQGFTPEELAEDLGFVVPAGIGIPEPAPKATGSEGVETAGSA